ncbi:hypothetical protein LTR36_004422 [Oleoguttula mirabilis]|uniref:BRCT domain-containing protein n=1 Tax=Oleoguttula mirabilis TaxID=1507867 RepID=A0AAV9JG26_9PEZI|nr:hypothetical protein LTR36_004422 [Oleoguttula mirabilis]
MASLAEGSVASIPISNLAALREQLLLHRQPAASAQQVPEAESDNNDKDETHRASTTNEPSGSASAVTPESADAYRTPHSSPNAHHPRLTSSKPAPATELEAMMQRSPSQRAFGGMTRAESFNGYPGGDTQPMESQVYRDYNESVAAMSSRTTVTPQKKEKAVLYISPDGKVNTYDTTVTDKTPKTCAEGETGFIDLADAWQRESSQGARSTTSDMEELLASPETQLHLPEDLPKPTMPETPAMAGHKRSRSGEILTSAMATTNKTPGLSQLFGGEKAPVMGATQLFGQTQMPSSPLPDAPRSDPIFTRPSPNINHQMSVSSPAMVMSSPVATMHARPSSSTAGEPRDNYTSMRESQDRRAALLRAESGLSALEEDDDDEDSQQRRIAQRRMQRVISDQELSKWEKLKAPSRPGSRPTSRRKHAATIDLVTPATMRKGGRVEFSISDDENDSDDDLPVNDHNEELPLNEDDNDRTSVQEQDEDDVYDELGQTVLRSQPDERVDDDEHRAVDGSVQEDEEIRNDANTDDAGTTDARSLVVVVDEQDAEHAAAEEERGIIATQRSAIADSQPLRQNRVTSVQRRETHEQSSMSSFVPGSQYAGKTSQEQAHMRASGLRQSSTSQLQMSEKLPSSPPLPTASSTLPEGSAEASIARREMLARFQPHAQPVQAQARSEQEIPESDILASDSIRPGTSHSTAAFHTIVQGESNSVPIPFPTAQTHLSATGGLSPAKSPHKVFASQHSRLSAIDSPRGLAGVRRFADIAADPSPPNASGETELDVDAIMDDVMTAEDREFIEAVSSPVSEKASKRRKITHAASRQISSRSASPTKLAQSHAPTEASAEAALPALPPNAQTLQSLVAEAREAVMMPATKPSYVLRSSPSKANELPVSTPENAELPKGTQESVKRREEAGAKAVSQLLTARSTRALKSGKLAGGGRKTSTLAAAVEDGSPKTAGKGKGLTLKLFSKKAAVTYGQRNSRSVRRRQSTPLADGDVAQPNAPAEEPIEPKAAVVEPQESGEDIEDGHDGHRPAITAPTRVFALFKGNFNNFYPATWLSSSFDGKSHRIQFDDMTGTNIEAQHVRSLDLRVGDQVKVDGPGWRNKGWIIKGFGKVAATDEERAVGTDVYGRTTAKVQAKSSSRQSLPASNSVQVDEDEVVEVLITNVYLTHTMWPGLRDRAFAPPETVRRDNSRLATPSTGLPTPDVETPVSRSRRATVPTSKAAARRTSHLREESVATNSSFGGAGLFSGMAFAISYGTNEAEKAEVTRHIQRNGGIILENGFDELFDLPNLDDTAATAAADAAYSGLGVKPEYEHLGFVALIADSHTRRAKYMQALALGLPTLSGRWIADSLSAAERSQDAGPLPWHKYLLAAGESAYLNGAVRSRAIPAYSAAEARLADTIANREILLNGDGVLIVAPMKSKAVWKRRKAYAFLTLALGAGSVKRVADLAEAKALTEDGESWKWVYVDGSVADASAVLFGAHGDAAAKKRKRGADAVAKVDGKAMSVASSDGKVKIVNDEFVVQSLILGALVD